MRLINILIVSLSGLMSVPSMAQDYCATYPNEASCCNPEFDNCIPREIYLRYGHKAGDFCVPGYPSTVSCGGTASHAANYSSPEEALRWRMGFMSAYWDSGSSKQCKPLRLEGPYGNWSGDISALRLHEIQSQNWGTVVSQEGSPYPEPGPISCATPRELTDQFYITRYLVEEECEAGFLPANRVPDDVRVCSKKGLWEIKISGPEVTQSLPSLAGPIMQGILVRRGGKPAAFTDVSISLKEEGSASFQNFSLKTNVNGEAQLLYIPPYLKSTTVEMKAECSKCIEVAKKNIKVLMSDLSVDEESPASCRRRDF